MDWISSLLLATVRLAIPLLLISLAELYGQRAGMVNIGLEGLASIGALVGFLWYNAYPAQVFMGDTGSLTLGGIIAVFSILIRKELLIPILCGIFLVENLSVILQTAYFKYTRHKTGTGRRIFKMAPLHHHFQKQGTGDKGVLWQHPFNAIPESKITVRFWIIGIFLAILTFITLKIR